tara:strand:- start:769 stop:1254 length:486 start_codon:yes stop_codon:yes gene_type:complete
MNLIMYGLQAPNDYNLKSTLFSHKLYTKQKKLLLVPNKFDDTIIDPKNFLKLKEKMKIKETLLIDKTIPKNKRMCITNHVNRSGYNFLIGKTPIANLSRFPDMSKVYNEISGLESAVVHTVGPERFHLRPKSNNVISESVGLIAPVWHYVGVKVFAQNFID